MKPNTPGFMGERLKEAREARGLSATALADLLQVSRQSVSKYESGLQSPSPQVMDDICKLLRIPPDFFLSARKRTVDRKSPIFYRSLSVATKTERLRAETRYIWLQDIFSYLWQYVEFPDVNLPEFNDIPEDPALITNDLIEDLAVRTRRFWNLGDGPINNLIWLLENNGIIVGSYNLEAATLDAFSQMSFNRPHIVLGIDGKSAVRSRFNAAHELGHLILHRHVPSKYLGAAQHFKLIEDQAHRFAGAFHFTAPAFAEEVTNVSLESFRILKYRWQISIAAMLQRAEQLGFISREEAQPLWRSYTRRGWKKQEPLDDEISPETPQLLKNAFELIIENGIQTRADVLRKLKLSAYDIEEIASLPSSFLQPEIINFPTPKVFRSTESFEVPAEVVDLFKRF